MVCTLLAAPAAAHAPDADAPPDLAHAWSLEPWLGLPLLLALVLYGLGVARLWRAGAGRGVGGWQVLSFGCGWAVLFLAMVWPLDALGAWSLAAHMAQHMLLLAFAPPLLLAGLAGPVWLAALPAGWARPVMRPLRSPAGQRTWAVLTGLTFATLLQAGVMWGWHLPAAMDHALAHEPTHYAMHLSFLLAGLLFWTGVLRSLREPRHGAGAGLLALLATMVHMGLLSALMTFAETPRFGWYLERAPMLGLDPLQDQQLAGLIMWVPAALPYVIGAIVLVAAWLSRSEARSRRGTRLQG